MRLKNLLLSKLSLLLILMLVTLTTQAQTLDKIKIKEYYFGEPLNNVLKDFQTKYGVVVKYDSTFTAPYQFDDQGRFDVGATVNAAFEAICSDIKTLSFYIDENEVVHLVKKELSITSENKVNTKQNVAATKNNVKASGQIKDANTGESLPFAAVGIMGTTEGTKTNKDGFFTLFKVPSDTSTLYVSYMGYEKAYFYLNPKMELSNLIIELIPTTKALSTVVIKTDREDLMRSTDEVSIIKMSPKKIAMLPNVGEKDIFRSFQLLPGVSGSNEASSGLYVRGGTPDQNLTLYDGFTVYHVDHLFGMFSAFNSNAVKDVLLHKGGFESKFGGRISSVMEIIGKDGNEKNFNLGGDIGLLSANIFTEIPIKDKVTILLAGRRSWKSPIYNSIFKSFNESTEEETVAAPTTGRRSRTTESTTPTSYFYDLNAKITYKPTSKDIISYSFFNGRDDLDNSRELNRNRNGTTTTGGITDATKWGSWGMSTTWSRKWTDEFYTSVLASASNYFSERDLRNSRSIIDADGIATDITRGSFESNKLKDYTFRLDNELKLGKNNQLEFGLQAKKYNINYDYSLNDSISIQDRNDNGTVLSGYVQDEVKLFNRLTLVPGLRASYYDVTDKTYMEPRASLRFKVSDKIKLKGAWGHYYQFANRIIRNDISSGSRDFWVLADDKAVPISFAEHFIAGASYETKGYIFDVEAYYKKLDGLSEYSLQFAPSFNNVDFNEFFYEGTGIAKGVEFLLQKKFGKYNGWIGYTLGEVKYNFPIYGENDFYANHDVTNEFKIVNTYKYKKWTFAATWIYATGKPYTDPLGGYSITLLDGSTEDFINIGEKNNARYPDYHRLDVSANYNFNMGETANGTLGFSIFNAYNRKNIWYKQFEVDAGDLIETNVNLLGFTPSISLSMRLR